MSKTELKEFVDFAAELVAFQCEPPFVVRRGLTAMAANPRHLAEVEQVFGMSMPQLSRVLEEHNKLDLEFFPVNYD